MQRVIIVFLLKKKSFLSVLHKLINESVEKKQFHQNFKLPGITLVCKKNDPLDKKNYRPVSLLSVVSNIFERIIQKQVNRFIFYFSPYLCGKPY